jgi:hypothetical protein
VGTVTGARRSEPVSIVAPSGAVSVSSWSTRIPPESTT